VRVGVAASASQLKVVEVVVATFNERGSVVHLEVVVVSADDACAVACPDLGADRCPLPSVADAAFGALADGAA